MECPFSLHEALARIGVKEKKIISAVSDAITSACKILTYSGWQHIGLMDAGNNS